MRTGIGEPNWVESVEREWRKAVRADGTEAPSTALPSGEPFVFTLSAAETHLRE